MSTISPDRRGCCLFVLHIWPSPCKRMLPSPLAGDAPLLAHTHLLCAVCEQRSWTSRQNHEARFAGGPYVLQSIPTSDRHPPWISQSFINQMMLPVFLVWTSEEEALFICPPIIRKTPSGRVCSISLTHCTCHHLYCFAKLVTSISAIPGSRPDSLLCSSIANPVLILQHLL